MLLVFLSHKDPSDEIAVDLLVTNAAASNGTVQLYGFAAGADGQPHHRLGPISAGGASFSNNRLSLSLRPWSATLAVITYRDY